MLGQQQNAGSCRVEFLEPKQGDTISDSGDVRGKATVPAGKHLWIFAHRRGLELWWPQGGGPAHIENGEWVSFVTFGQERDRGSEFEVAGVVLEEVDHAAMLNLIRRYEERGVYPGTSLPRPAQGCSMSKMIVMKR
jgi:hypothetical protein